MHRPFVHYTTLKAGSLVIADSGFRCLECGEICEVEQDEETKQLCVICSGGIHTLETDARGYVTGFYPCEGKN